MLDDLLTGNLEAFVSAIALIVSVIVAVVSRYQTKKDIEYEKKSNISRERYSTFFEMLFDFLETSSPEFIDDIYDMIFKDDILNQDIDKYLLNIDNLYAEISRRKSKMQLQIIKMETYCANDIPKSEKIMDVIYKLYDECRCVFSKYEMELQDVFDANNNFSINDELLFEVTNAYQNYYNETINNTIKELMIETKKELL